MFNLLIYQREGNEIISNLILLNIMYEKKQALKNHSESGFRVLIHFK